jgi:hypothetical protein
MSRGDALCALCLLGLVLGCASTELKRDPGAPGTGGAGSLEPLSLEPGEVAELSVAEDGTAGERLATPTGSEQFVVLLASTEFDVTTPAFHYSLTPGALAKAGASTLLTTCSLSSAAWSKGVLPREEPPTGAAPAEGATRSLDILTPKGSSSIEARAVAVGEHSVVWVDTTNATSLDSAFVSEFLSDFEQLIMPRERAVFGAEPDLDGDGRIQLVFSPLTYQTAVAFFTGCDLMSTLTGCPSSNHGEFVYLTPPDAIDPPYNTPKAIKEILAHEISHLLHFNRKVLKNKLRAWSDSLYMVEGVGALAQDVIGYQAGNLYVAMAGLDGLDQLSLGDTLTDLRPYDTARDGALRGGSYWFVRYLYDRGGGDAQVGSSIENRGGPAFLRALLDARSSVASALPEVAGTQSDDVALDFFTALALSNRDQDGGVAPKNPCFSYLPVELDSATGNPRGASPYASFHGMHMKGPKVQSATAADGSLLAGGVELLQLDANGGASELTFALSVSPEAKPRVRVGRWK